MFCSQQWLADGKNAMLLPPELASSGQPISNGIGQPQDSWPPISAYQHSPGSDVRGGGRGEGDDPGRYSSGNASLPVSSTCTSTAFVLLYPACTEPPFQRQPTRAVRSHTSWKIANEHVEIVIVPHPREAASQSESKTTGNVLSAAQMDSERENMRNCNSKMSERVSNELPVIIQSSMWER